MGELQVIDGDAANWISEPPFKPFLHRWEKILGMQSQAAVISSMNGEGDTSRKEALDALVSFFDPLLKSGIESLATMRDKGSVSFADVWQLFPPGELIVTRQLDVDIVCRVVECREDKELAEDGVTEVEGADPNSKSWRVEYQFADWYGEGAGGYVSVAKTIDKFSGSKKVRGLVVYPLSFSKDPEGMRSMTARGRRFEELRGFHYLEGSGVKVLIGDSARRPFSGRVVLDAYDYYRSEGLEIPQATPFEGQDADATASTDEDDNDSDGIPEIDVTENDKSVSRNENLVPMTDEQFLLASPWQIGMDLKTKEWGMFQTFP